MSELISISTSNQRRSLVDVIFVHGLQGDAHNTWSADGTPKKFWPKWLAEDIPNSHVWSLGYEAAVTSWFGNSMPLVDMGLNLLAILEAAEIGKRPIIFVCHSLGGLIVKQILRSSASHIVDSGGKIADATAAVVFFATPHSGSQKATWMEKFRLLMWPSAAATDLVSNSAPLRDLNLWYRGYAADKSLKNQSYYETQKTSGFHIVDPNSADGGIPGNVPIPVDANHLSICKPDSRESLVYNRVLTLVTRTIEVVAEGLEDESKKQGESTAAQDHHRVPISISPMPEMEPLYDSAKMAIEDTIKTFGHKAEIKSLANKPIPGLRKFLSKKLMREEIKVIWFDTFGEDMDELHPNASVSNCIISMLTKANKRTLMEELIENIVLERPDMAANINNNRFD